MCAMTTIPVELRCYTVFFSHMVNNHCRLYFISYFPPLETCMEPSDTMKTRSWKGVFLRLRRITRIPGLELFCIFLNIYSYWYTLNEMRLHLSSKIKFIVINFINTHTAVRTYPSLVLLQKYCGKHKDRFLLLLLEFTSHLLQQSDNSQYQVKEYNCS